MSGGGIFIVMDGTEGCGKSTQSRIQATRLADLGRDVVHVRDPGTTRIGEQIRTLLLDPANSEMAMRTEMLLYMSARAQMMAENITPALDRDAIVICDRFVSSTLAYQLGGDGLTAQQIRNVADIAISRRWPDLTILLDLTVEQSLARVKRAKDRIEQRPMEYHEQVRRNYLQQARENPSGYRVLNADRTPDEVSADVWSVVSALLEERR
jgi:dTMP kinase